MVFPDPAPAITKLLSSSLTIAVRCWRSSFFPSTRVSKKLPYLIEFLIDESLVVIGSDHIGISKVLHKGCHRYQTLWL